MSWNLPSLPNEADLQTTRLRRGAPVLPSAVLIGGVAFLLGATAVLAQPAGRPGGRAHDESYLTPIRREFVVDGVPRAALVFVPKEAQNSPAPLVFAFHGHGGTMQRAEEMFGFHQHWPEAIVVYPQGLPTPTPADPEGKRPGWTVLPLDEQNRDLRFFDVMLTELEQLYRVDRRRIYASGHSNGGFFTYTLWAARPQVLAAVAPSACTTARLGENVQLTPKPVFHVAGEQDALVPIESQRRTIEQLKTLNGCAGERAGRRPSVRLFPSAAGTPVVTFIHPGGHGYPQAASAAIVEFFKRQGGEEPSEPAS